MRAAYSKYVVSCKIYIAFTSYGSHMQTYCFTCALVMAFLHVTHLLAHKHMLKTDTRTHRTMFNLLGFAGFFLLWLSPLFRPFPSIFVYDHKCTVYNLQQSSLSLSLAVLH